MQDAARGQAEPVIDKRLEMIPPRFKSYHRREITPDFTWFQHCQDVDQMMYELIDDPPSWYEVGRKVHTMIHIFCIKDDYNMVFDTGPDTPTDHELELIEQELDGEDLDYLVISHPDVDHTGSVTKILKRYPECTLVGPEYGAGHDIYYLDDDAMLVGRGDEIDLGTHTIRFYRSPYEDSAISHYMFEEETGTLFTADWMGYFHMDNECGKFAEEIKQEGYDERLIDHHMRVFWWGEWVDTDRLEAEIDYLIDEVDPDIIAPSHGPIIRDEPIEALHTMKTAVRRSKEEGRSGKYKQY